jgi:hypothetical protein
MISLVVADPRSNRTRRATRCNRPLPFAGFGTLRRKLRRQVGFFMGFGFWDSLGQCESNDDSHHGRLFLFLSFLVLPNVFLELSIKPVDVVNPVDLFGRLAGHAEGRGRRDVLYQPPRLCLF